MDEKPPPPHNASGVALPNIGVNRLRAIPRELRQMIYNHLGLCIGIHEISFGRARVDCRHIFKVKSNGFSIQASDEFAKLGKNVYDKIAEQSKRDPNYAFKMKKVVEAKVRNADIASLRALQCTAELFRREIGEALWDKAVLVVEMDENSIGMSENQLQRIKSLPAVIRKANVDIRVFTKVVIQPNTQDLMIRMPHFDTYTTYLRTLGQTEHDFDHIILIPYSRTKSAETTRRMENSIVKMSQTLSAMNSLRIIEIVNDDGLAYRHVGGTSNDQEAFQKQVLNNLMVWYNFGQEQYRYGQT